jgi:hypothetical protein
MAYKKNLHRCHPASTAVEIETHRTKEKIRQTFGHFDVRILAIDPHRVKSYSKRQMPRRKKDKDSKPAKLAQAFFCLDVDSEEPICFTTACSARTVTQATPEMLTITAKILKFNGQWPVVMADSEHYTVELVDWITETSPYDLLFRCPIIHLFEAQLSR